jgi:hypothetical protein
LPVGWNKEYDLVIGLEHDIINEIQTRVQESLDRIDGSAPNAAKNAGIVAFWIRKLKPLSIHPTSEFSFLPLNEYVALRVGLSICARYFDDARKQKISLNPRILRDWVFSFRYNSHSPHSSLISFEMLACDK